MGVAHSGSISPWNSFLREKISDLISAVQPKSSSYVTRRNAFLSKNEIDGLFSQKSIEPNLSIRINADKEITTGNVAQIRYLILVNSLSPRCSFPLHLGINWKNSQKLSWTILSCKTIWHPPFLNFPILFPQDPHELPSLIGSQNSHPSRTFSSPPNHVLSSPPGNPFITHWPIGKCVRLALFLEEYALRRCRKYLLPTRSKNNGGKVENFSKIRYQQVSTNSVDSPLSKFKNRCKGL